MADEQMLQAMPPTQPSSEGNTGLHPGHAPRLGIDPASFWFAGRRSIR